jgi:hypothetical protein
MGRCSARSGSADPPSKQAGATSDVGPVCIA